MLMLPINWMETRPPDQPALTSYDTGYEHSLEHLLVVMALVEREAVEGMAAGAA